MIKIEDVKKSFGDKEVLKGISAEFTPGHCNMIIGSSGSGKTVLMKCVVGLLKPDHGRILYDGRDFTKMNYREKKDLRQEIGMLFQNSALFDSLSVEDNVAFPMKMFTKMSARQMRERVNFCLERVNLDVPRVNKLFPDEISGGMKKRVGIARAISLKPKYLFCDEPNSGLDPITSTVIDKLIKEITVDFNTTTVINTHDMNSVLEYGDDIVFLYNGNLHWKGNSAQIKTAQDETLKEFIYANQFIRDVHFKEGS